MPLTICIKDANDKSVNKELLSSIPPHGSPKAVFFSQIKQLFKAQQDSRSATKAKQGEMTARMCPPGKLIWALVVLHCRSRREKANRKHSLSGLNMCSLSWHCDFIESLWNTLSSANKRTQYKNTAVGLCAFTKSDVEREQLAGCCGIEAQFTQQTECCFHCFHVKESWMLLNYSPEETWTQVFCS